MKKYLVLLVAMLFTPAVSWALGGHGEPELCTGYRFQCIPAMDYVSVEEVDTIECENKDGKQDENAPVTLKNPELEKLGYFVPYHTGTIPYYNTIKQQLYLTEPVVHNCEIQGNKIRVEVRALDQSKADFYCNKQDDPLYIDWWVNDKKIVDGLLTQMPCNINLNVGGTQVYSLVGGKGTLIRARYARYGENTTNHINGVYIGDFIPEIDHGEAYMQFESSFYKPPLTNQKVHGLDIDARSKK